MRAKTGVTSRFAEVYVDCASDLIAHPSLAPLRARLVDVCADGALPEREGVLLLGSLTSDGARAEVTARALRRGNPHLVIYLCTGWNQLEVERLQACARSGVDRVLAIDTASEVAELVEMVRARLAAPPPTLELAQVGELGLAHRLRSIAQYALRNAYRPEPVAGLAVRFGYAARTLRGMVQGTGGPRLEDLWRCGRYLHGVELERRGVGGLAERAERLGFGSATVMRKWCWRLRGAMRAERRLSTFAARIPALARLRASGTEW